MSPADSISECMPRGRTAYSYDALSNLTERTQGTETTTYSHDASSRLTSSSGPAGDATYTYDPAGYMTAIAAPDDQDSRFSYDAAGRLTELASPEADQSYSYGPSGRRVGTKTSTEETGGKLNYLWDPSFSLGQIAEISGSQERSFAYGRGRIAQTGPGGSSYLHTDNLGSVVATTDERGQRSSHTTYNPYGSPAEAKGGSESSSFAYTGQLREEGTGRYHLRARDYDPEMAAFQTPDPISPGLGEPARSPYSYVGGRPTTMVDPSGMIGIGDVTPDFIEEGAKAIDDNVIDPVGNGISAAPGVVGDAASDAGGWVWDNRGYVAGGLAVAGIGFCAAATAGACGIAALAGGSGALAATGTAAGLASTGLTAADVAHGNGVFGPNDFDPGGLATDSLLTFGGGHLTGKAFKGLTNFHSPTKLGSTKLGSVTIPPLAQHPRLAPFAPFVPRSGEEGFDLWRRGVAGLQAGNTALQTELGQHGGK